MTKLGKLLTFLNLVAAVVVLSWAASLFGNQAPWLDRKTETESVKGQITLMKEEIDKLGKSITDAQAAYGTKGRDLASAETTRDYRKARYAQRLDEARKGTFRVQVPMANDRTFVDLEKQGPVVLEPNSNKPLRGVDEQARDFAEQVRLARMYREGTQGRVPPAAWANLGKLDLNQLGIDDLLEYHGRLSDLVKVVNDAVGKQRDALANLRGEAQYLSDQRVNWAAELQILERRQRQLEAQLRRVGGGPAGGQGGN